MTVLELVAIRLKKSSLQIRTGRALNFPVGRKESTPVELSQNSLCPVLIAQSTLICRPRLGI